MMDEDYTAKLQRAERDEVKVVDADGCVFWVDSFDNDSVYYHADEGDTHRASHSQFREWMTFVEA